MTPFDAAAADATVPAVVSAAPRVTSVRIGRRRDRDLATGPRPLLSWTVDAPRDWVQRTARFRLDGREVAEADGPDGILRPWPLGDLTGVGQHRIEVQVIGIDGRPSPWSDPLEFETSVVGDRWTAPMMGLPEPTRPATPVILRRVVDIASTVVGAVLRSTAHGVYQVAIDGVDIDDHLLKPGWTAYRSRLAAQVTDVTHLIRPGEPSVLGVRLAGGWWTEAYGFGETARRIYGEQPSVAVELRLVHDDGSVEVVADGAWRVSESDELVTSGIYAGEFRDARRRQTGWHEAGFDDSAWQPAALSQLRTEPVVIDVEPIRRIEEVAPVDVLTTPSGGTILDFGRILVGRVRCTVAGPGGDTVTLRHAEVLEDGELCVRALRAAESVDRFTLAGDGPETVEPEFTFHGFRYVEVGGLSVVDPDAFRAVVIRTDMPRTGRFSCSDPRLEQLHENVVRSVAGNSVGLLTDCPQRDERMGWTGDAQVVAPAASSVFGIHALLASWLEDLALEQTGRDGLVPTVVPDVLGELSDVAAAGWGDAAVLVPMTLHERYGDVDVLRRSLPSMRAWVERIHREAGKGRLWERGFQYGDWLDPTASRPDKAKADPGLVASAYLHRSTRALALAFRAVAADDGTTDEGDELTAQAERFESLAAEVAHAFRATYLTSAGRLMSDAPAAYALTLVFGLVDDAALRRRLAERLAFLLRAGGYRIATGFLGTPVVLDALLDAGLTHEAEMLLLQTECPSWLYPISQGATTVWERWDSMLPDGSINPSGMTSFNHVALGSVLDVLHRRVGGVAPAAPGYARLRIEPWFVSRLEHAHLEQTTPHGPVSVSWRRGAAGMVSVEARVPVGTTATVVLPGHEVFEVGAGRHAWTVAATAVGRKPGPEMGVDADLAALADVPDACALVSRLLARHDVALGREFDAFVRWVPGRTLRAELAAVSPPPTLVDTIDAALRGLTGGHPDEAHRADPR